DVDRGELERGLLDLAEAPQVAQQPGEPLGLGVDARALAVGGLVGEGDADPLDGVLQLVVEAGEDAAMAGGELLEGLPPGLLGPSALAMGGEQRRGEHGGRCGAEQQRNPGEAAEDVDPRPTAGGEPDQAREEAEQERAETDCEPGGEVTAHARTTGCTKR